jgi:general secretion pathway protein F
MTDYAHDEPPSEAPESDAAGWTLFIFLPAVWLIPCLIFTAVVAVLTGLAFIPQGWAMSPIAALFAAYAIDRAVRKRRAMQVRTILGYLHHAVRLNLPFDPYLAAAAESERGRVRRGLGNLRDLLAAGDPIHVALARAVPDLPPCSAATLAAAEPVGQFAPALARLVTADRAAPADADTERATYGRFYPLALLLMLSGISIFYITFVVPKVREVLADFKTPVPPLTGWILALSSVFADNIPIGILALFTLIFLIFAPMSYYLHRVFLPFWRLPALGSVGEMVRWWVPILRGIERDRGMAITAEFLADATTAGVPLPAAVERTLELPTNPYFRAKLRRWADLLVAGEAPADAARRAGLPGLLAGLIGPGHSQAAGETLPALFAFLARYYRGRFSRTVLLLRAASEPFLVLFFGMLVFCFSAGVILPIVRILNRMMGADAPEAFL